MPIRCERGFRGSEGGSSLMSLLGGLLPPNTARVRWRVFDLIVAVMRVCLAWRKCVYGGCTLHCGGARDEARTLRVLADLSLSTGNFVSLSVQQMQSQSPKKFTMWARR